MFLLIIINIGLRLGGWAGGCTGAMASFSFTEDYLAGWAEDEDCDAYFGHFESME